MIRWLASNCGRKNPVSIALMPWPKSMRRLLHRHAGFGTVVDIEQEQCTIAARRQDHAFGYAEAHLARCEVRDEHDFAPYELLRHAVAGADAGKNLALAELARIELETQQPVRVFHKATVQHRGDTQVEFGEIVDGDCGRAGGY